VSPAFEYPNGAIRVVAYSPSIRDLALVSRDGVLAVWSRHPLGVRAEFLERQSRVRSAAFSPDGKTIAACVEPPGDGLEYVKVWDVANYLDVGGGKPRFGGIVRGPSAPAFSPDGRALAAAGRDGLIHLFDLSSGRQRAQYQAEGGLVRLLVFNPDGRTLVSVGSDNAIRFREVSSGLQAQAPITSLKSPANCLAFSPDGKTIAFSWTPPHDKPEIVHEDVFYSIDQKERWIGLYPAGHEEKGGRVLMESRHTILALAFSPNGDILASAGGAHEGEGEVKLWDVATGRLLADLKGHRRTVTCVAFSPDGKTLVTAGGWIKGPGEIKVWDLRTLESRELSRKD
jgi:WD40 repeat protein